MLQRPNFKAHYRAEVVSGDGLVLLSETGHALLQGRLYELVAPYIDGRRTVDDIADLLRGQAAPSEVYEAVAHLEREGHLAEGEETMPAGEAALWALQEIVPQTAAQRLEAARVSVRALGDVAVEPFVAAIQ